MTEISGPWASTVLGDATLAPYTDEEWATIWRALFHADKADDWALLATGTAPDDGLTVNATSPASASVDITPGAALVRGRWYRSDAVVNKSVAANASGNPRIDSIILRIDYIAQTVRLAVLAGTPAATPVPPSLTQVAGTTWEVAIADIAVANGFVSIAQADITPRRQPSNVSGAIVLDGILNNSGAVMTHGMPVIWDTTADRAVTTTTQLGHGLIAGVVQGRIPVGGRGRIMTRGISQVFSDAAVAARGLTLVTGTTAGRVTPKAAAATASKMNPVGISLEITAGAGFVWTYVDIRKHPERAIVSNVGLKGATSTTSGTFVDAAGTRNITITPHASEVRVTMCFNSYATGTGTGHYDIYSVGLAARAGDAAAGLAIVNAGFQSNVTISWVFTGLTPGVAQEFRLQYKSSVAGQQIILGDLFMAHAEEV